MRSLSDNRVEHLRGIAANPDFSSTKYGIVKELARGGLGTVYLAEDTELSRQVAIKVLLGAFDGLTAWFTPAVRDQLAGIVVSSTFKGVIAGIAMGFFAKKFHSLPIGILFGLAVGALLAFLTARFAVGGYYFQIMLPGSMVGLIVGFATQKYGKAPTVAHN